MKTLKSLRFLLTHAWKTNRRYFLLTLLKNVSNAALPLISIVGIGTIVNTLTTTKQYRDILVVIAIYLSINLGITVFKELLNLAELYVMRKASNSAQFAWSEDTVKIDYHYAQDGTIQDLRMKSMGAHPAFYINNIGSIFNYIVQLACVIYIFSSLSPVFILIIAAISMLSIVLIFKSKKNDFDFRNEKIEEDRKIDSYYKIMTTYRFAKELRMNSAEGFIINKYLDILKTQIRKLKTLYNKTTKISLLSSVLFILETIIMYLYFSYQAYTVQITIAQYTVLLGATTLFASLLLNVFDSVAQLGRTCKTVDFYADYRALMDEHSTIYKSSEVKGEAVDFSDIVIRFENVSFNYPNTDNEVLKNINLEIKNGEKIGIVGLNGSGKTTLVKLLTRLYDPTEGRITINGTDIRAIAYDQYIKHIGIVLQDFQLFAYSIKENIVLDNDYNGAELLTSIEKSGLRDKVNGLKDSVDTSIYKTLDVNGIEFSGGEGQKLALARAIYKNTEILILDEPTSALDPIAEYAFFSSLNDLSGGKTTIFISHRLSSTKFCDKIIVLSDGAIIEAGSHDDLIKRNGFYADLFNTQARYYKERGVAGNE